MSQKNLAGIEKDYNSFNSLLSSKVKSRRESLKLSMKKLYSLSGVSSSTINDIEKGKYIPNLAVIFKLCRALDISLLELMPSTKVLRFQLSEEQG